MSDLVTLGRRLVLCLAVIMAPALAVAGEVPEAVRLACSNDYQKHCIKHQPGSEAGRECMADVFEKLSDGCVNAIMSSNLVDDGPEPAAEDKSQVAETAAPATKTRQAAKKTRRTSNRTRRVAKSRKKRRVRTARNTRNYRVRSRRNDARKFRRRGYASRKSRRTRYASGGGRIGRRISRGLRIADRHVSRALARAFRF